MEAGRGSPTVPLWRRLLVPATISERHAIEAFIVGFLLEVGTEIYQFVITEESIHSSPVGYYTSLATTLVGFYFFWRGFHEWNRLHPRPPRAPGRHVPWIAVAFFVGGTAATAALDFALGTVGSGDVPAPVVWLIGGLMVLAFGSFFLRLRTLVAHLQRWPGLSVGWAAFVWSLGVSTIAGLALGRVIRELVVDFFTNWPLLILNLAPFIFGMTPLFVTFILLAIGYADARRRAPSGPSKISATAPAESV